MSNATDTGRRSFLRPAGASAALLPAIVPAAAAPLQGQRLFDVTAYSATGKGKQLDHPAIEARNRAGGGVYVEAGATL